MAYIPRSTQAEKLTAIERLSGLRARFRGGPEGNERLTALTGAVLFVLLAALGVTIVQIGQLIWLHLFLGLVLIGPVVLKMASTGYRFALYYVRDPTYRSKGPPETWLRLSAPVIVLTTVGVFATGVPLLFIAPVNREPLAEIHKIFFIVWVVFTALHVLGHLPEMARLFMGDRGARTQIAGLGDDGGRTSRALALAGALVVGLVLAVVFIPHFASWTSFHHHHH